MESSTTAEGTAEDEYDFEDPPSKPLVLLRREDVGNADIIAHIEADVTRNLYAATDWSLPFYLQIAWHGFIAIAHEQRDGSCLLLPEMQYSYAHLSLDALHVSTKARKRSSKFTLRLNQNLDGVLAGIEASHDSWVIKPYQDLLRILSRRAVRVPLDGGGLLRVHSVELVNT